uniref:Uncharacterized protein n=1 Tax=Anguilla anguilla TaxID=7936 RepID=A0A0E9UI74_ANGAN
MATYPLPRTQRNTASTDRNTWRR